MSMPCILCPREYATQLEVDVMGSIFILREELRTHPSGDERGNKAYDPLFSYLSGIFQNTKAAVDALHKLIDHHPG